MLDYKLFKLMQVLVSKELLEMERYLATPIINTNADVQKLFAQLCKYHPAFDYPKLSKEWLYTKVYGKVPYNDGKLRKLMTQLTQLIEQFLITKELNASEDIQAKLLARSLAGRQNYELFLEAVDARLKVLDKGVERGRDYFREGYELSEMLYYHPGSGKTDKRGEYYDKTISDLEQYFSLVLLQNEADNIVRTRVTKEQSSSKYFGKILEKVDSGSFTFDSAIYFFRKIIKLLSEQGEENLEDLKDTAFRFFGQFSRFEQDFALNLLINYAVPMSNKGSLPHKRFVLEMYKMELYNGSKTNPINSNVFMNIVTIGLSLSELEWVKEFIEEFSKRLSGKDKDVTINYCLGLCSYSIGLKKNELNYFYEGLYYLNKVSVRSEPNYEIRVRAILLRIHFEIFERKKETLEDILNLVRNFTRYLDASDDYAKSIHDSYIQFLRYFKYIARLMDAPQLNIKSALQLKKKLLEDDSDVAFKPWLLEKIDGLFRLE